MSDEFTQAQCSNPDCQVAKDGVCIDGHLPFSSCPNIIVVQDDDLGVYDDDSAGKEDELSTADDFIPLDSGEVLGQCELDAFLRCRRGVIVTIIGDSGSGKTTLISSLYDRYLKGTFAGFSFLGSRTLVAFERRSHHSRVASGCAKPETSRTFIPDGLGFYHLALNYDNEKRHRLDFLISDRAGEIYQDLKKNPKLALDLPEVSQASVFVLLLDGARVVDHFSRSNALQSVRQTLRALIDSGALNKSSIVQIVMTKIDLIEGSTEKDIIHAAVDSFQEILKKSFASRLQKLTFWEISARDPSGSMSPAYGLDLLIVGWANARIKCHEFFTPQFELRSEFDRLLERTNSEAYW